MKSVNDAVAINSKKPKSKLEKSFPLQKDQFSDESCWSFDRQSHKCFSDVATSIKAGAIASGSLNNEDKAIKKFLYQIPFPPSKAKIVSCFRAVLINPPI